MDENEIAVRARQLADKIEHLPEDVLQSYKVDDIEKRGGRLQSSTTEILYDMAPVVSWLEVRDSGAADLLKRRLLLVCDEAQACVVLPKNDPRAAELWVLAVKTSESIRILAGRVDAVQSDAVAKGDDTKDDTPKKKRRMNKPASVCAMKYRRASARGEQVPIKSIVDEYVTENGGSAHSIMRVLNDNPDQWKNTT